MATRSPYSAKEWQKIEKLASEKGPVLSANAALKKLREEDVLKDFQKFKRSRHKL